MLTLRLRLIRGNLCSKLNCNRNNRNRVREHRVGINKLAEMSISMISPLRAKRRQEVKHSQKNHLK